MRALVSRAKEEGTISDDVARQRINLFATFLFGLDAANRAGADESEISELIDALHTTGETWRR